MAVVNHVEDGKPVKARLPWLRGALPAVTELTAQDAAVDPGVEQTFAPLDVRVYRYAGR